MATDLAAGIWRSDRTHSSLAFFVPHRGLSRIRGRFNDFRIVVTIDEQREWAACEIVVDARSVDTNDIDRDNMLRSMDYFDIASHPQHRFQATSITHVGDHYDIVGRTTINGVTHDTLYTAWMTGAITTGDGHHRAGFFLAGALSRAAFGLSQPSDPETAALPEADMVSVEAEVQVVLSS